MLWIAAYLRGTVGEGVTDIEMEPATVLGFQKCRLVYRKGKMKRNHGRLRMLSVYSST